MSPGRNSYLLLLLAVALAASCDTPRAENSKPGSLQAGKPAGLAAGVHFEVNLAHPGSTLVTLRITNASSGRITIKRARLPRIQNNWIVVALNERTLEQLPIALTLDSPPLGDLVLEPGASETEQVDLGQWFPTLSKLRANDNVVLFWAYTMRISSPVEAQRYYGGFTFERD